MNYAGAGFILLSSDLTHLLLVNDRRSGKWGFPKGHRESVDENDLATAVRECREETGLVPSDYAVHEETFKISKGSGAYLFRYATLREDFHHVRLYPGPAEEIARLEWVPLATLLEASCVVDGNKYLRTWIADLKTNVSKKAVHLFKNLVASRLPTLSLVAPPLSPRLGPSQEPASPCNIITCS
jgi:8-oxo-dGTP pyrophosphatase MutT (NUDIX family)